jgi:hypothetical protein
MISGKITRPIRAIPARADSPARAYDESPPGFGHGNSRRRLHFYDRKANRSVHDPVTGEIAILDIDRQSSSFRSLALVGGRDPLDYTSTDPATPLC